MEDLFEKYKKISPVLINLTEGILSLIIEKKLNAFFYDREKKYVACYRVPSFARNFSVKRPYSFNTTATLINKPYENSVIMTSALGVNAVDDSVLENPNSICFKVEEGILHNIKRPVVSRPRDEVAA